MKYPITPPPELVRQWCDPRVTKSMHFSEEDLATRAAQWGADQELEACCALMDDWGLDGEDLMECRRPKPPSLKEQALQALERFSVHDHAYADEMMADFDLISRALEQLDDNE